MPHSPLIPRHDSYDACYRAFQWNIPERFNIARAVCDHYAERTPQAIALICEDHDGNVQNWSFQQVQKHANQLANTLNAFGVQRGDRVGILLAQGVECLLSHLAAYKLGAIAVPLSELFGPEGLAHRLGNSGAKALISTARGCELVTEIEQELADLEIIISTSSAPLARSKTFWQLLEQASDHFDTVDTASEDPAILIYTSGTTGLPKGALHAHRTLLGHLPGVEFSFGFFPQPEDLIWTPAEWSWVAGILDVLLPGLYFGRPVLARRFAKFDAEAAFHLLSRHQVRNALIPPTALRMMRQIPKTSQPPLHLRSVMSGGESLGEEILDWGRETFAVTINEAYGQTECNIIVCQNTTIMPLKPGSMGRAIPGHRVAVIDAEGQPVATGAKGVVAALRPDPVMFLEYWNNPAATAEKFIGDWCVLGDVAHQDEDGYLWFHGREDDLINSAGYRIGPSEIEECLLKHPAVNLVGVVGKADPVRGEIVKAFIVPASGHQPSAQLISEIQQFVRTRLAAHEYPREIEFLEEMPLTVSGKIRRVDLRKRG